MPDIGQKLDKSILWKAEKFIPTKFGYNLIYIMVDPSDIESSHYLYMYDYNNKFKSGIIIYGKVLKVDNGHIEVDNSLTGWTTSQNLADIKINYKKIEKTYKGSIIDSSFIVDKMTYNKTAKTVTFKLRSSEKEFILSESEIDIKDKKFNDTLTKTLILSEINFEPYYKRQISINDIDKTDSINHSKHFFFRDNSLLTKFFTDIENNGL